MSVWDKIKSSCAALSPNCREASLALSEKLDHPLSPARRIGLQLHILVCKLCRRYGRQIHLIHSAASKHPDAVGGAGAQGLSDQARERIKRRVRETTD